MSSQNDRYIVLSSKPLFYAPSRIEILCMFIMIYLNDMDPLTLISLQMWLACETSTGANPLSKIGHGQMVSVLATTMGVR